MRSLYQPIPLLLALFLGPSLFGAATIGELGGPMEDRICLDCHGDRVLTKTNEDNQIITLFTDVSVLQKSGHSQKRCAECHNDLKESHPKDHIPAKLVVCGSCHEAAAITYSNSTHAIARRVGKLEAATCTSCHGKHDVASRIDENFPGRGLRLVETCGVCHIDTADEVKASAHGKALIDGQTGAPNCSSCHGRHQIQSLRHAPPMQIALQVCGKCHALRRLIEKFALPGQRLETYLEDYHGLLARAGETNVAHCASCHGHHKVLPADNPESLIHVSALKNTCAKCHEGAGEKFAAGVIHSHPFAEDTGSVVKAWVGRIYQALIVMIITGMVVHNVLAFIQTRKRLAAPLPSPHIPYTIAHHVQHVMLVIAFVLLALSGFALKYPESGLNWLVGGDEFIRRWLHRWAGIGLVAATIFHYLHGRLTHRGREFISAMIPGKTDVVEVTASIRGMTSGAEALPPGGRFSYVEKADYWAAVWGTAVMAITGFLIWFKISATQLLPRWMVDVAITIHFYEAVLACLAVVVWHLYHALLGPSGLFRRRK